MSLRLNQRLVIPDVAEAPGDAAPQRHCIQRLPTQQAADETQLSAQFIAGRRRGQCLARPRFHASNSVVDKDEGQIAHHGRFAPLLACLERAQEGAFREVNVANNVAQAGQYLLFLDQFLSERLIGDSRQHEGQFFGVGHERRRGGQGVIAPAVVEGRQIEDLLPDSGL